MLSTRVKLKSGATKTLQELGVKTYQDLEHLGGQAFAGGYNDPSTTYIGGLIQKEMGPNFDRITGQNDKYHHDICCVVI
jgi:hypothetical protein